MTDGFGQVDFHCGLPFPRMVEICEGMIERKKDVLITDTGMMSSDMMAWAVTAMAQRADEQRDVIVIDNLTLRAFWHDTLRRFGFKGEIFYLHPQKLITTLPKLPPPFVRDKDEYILLVSGDKFNPQTQSGMMISRAIGYSRYVLASVHRFNNRIEQTAAFVELFYEKSLFCENTWLREDLEGLMT